MKLSKIALSVAVLLGATITGGSWYTGKQAEANYQQMVSVANQSLAKLAAYGIQAEIKDVALNRHFFSSDVNYRLSVAFNNANYDLQGNDTLYHGPLPLNRLMQGNFLPALASIESRITLPDALKPLFHGKDLLGTAQNNVSYSGDLSGTFAIQPFKSEQGAWDFSGSEYRYDLNKSGSGFFEGKADRYQFSDPNGSSALVEKATYRVNFGKDQHPFTNLVVGDFTMSAEKIIADSLDNETIEMHNLVSSGSAKVENGRYKIYSDGQLSNILMADIALGKYKGDFLLEADAQTLNDLTPYLSDPQRFAYSDEVSKLLQALLHNAVNLHLNNIVLENEQGKNHLSLVLNFDGMQNAQDVMAILKQFKQSSLSGELNLAYVQAFVTEVAKKEGLTDEQASEQAKAMIAELVANANASQMVVADEKSLKINLSLDNGKVVLNGREVSEGELQMAMFMILMGLGSIGY